MDPSAGNSRVAISSAEVSRYQRRFLALPVIGQHMVVAFEKQI